jgi:hypothetical protein
VFRIALIQIVIMLSLWVVWTRIFQNGWDEGELAYPAVERFLVQHGVPLDEPILVLNAPGYYMMTGRPAFAQPYGDVDTLLAVAERYNIHYLAFEEQGKLKLMRDLYDHPEAYNQLEYLGEVNGTRIFQIP